MPLPIAKSQRARAEGWLGRVLVSRGARGKQPRRMPKLLPCSLAELPGWGPEPSSLHQMTQTPPPPARPGCGTAGGETCQTWRPFACCQGTPLHSQCRDMHLVGAQGRHLSGEGCPDRAQLLLRRVTRLRPNAGVGGARKLYGIGSAVAGAGERGKPPARCGASPCTALAAWTPDAGLLQQGAPPVGEQREFRNGPQNICGTET